MIGMIALSIVGVGCASTEHQAKARGRESGPAANAAVFVAAAIAEGENSGRFEFSRRDQLLGARTGTPLLGTREWPEYLPYEAPIRFRVWQQR